MLKYILSLTIILLSISSFAQQDSLVIATEKPVEVKKPEPPQNTLSKDVVYGRKYGLALTMDVYHPAKPNGAAIVFINSGGFLSPYFRNKEDNLKGSEWLVRNADPSFPSVDLGLKFSLEELLEEGYAIFDVTHSSSPKYMIQEILSDCEFAIKYIRFNADKFNIKPDKIGTWGMGEGAYIALYLSSIENNGKTNPENIKETNSKANTSVAFFPTGYDFVEEINKFPFLKFGLPSIDTDQEFIKSHSLAALISSDDSPALIVYGDQDNPFVIEPSENLVAAYKLKGVKSKSLKLKGTGTLFKGFDNKFNSNLYQQASKEQIKWYKKQLLNN